MADTSSSGVGTGRDSKASGVMSQAVSRGSNLGDNRVSYAPSARSSRAGERATLERLNENRKIMFLKLMQRVQEVGIQQFEHQKHPQLFDGTWMDGVRTHQQLLGGILANVTGADAAIRVYNILYPPKQLPKAHGDEQDIVKYFSGQAEDASFTGEPGSEGVDSDLFNTLQRNKEGVLTPAISQKTWKAKVEALLQDISQLKLSQQEQQFTNEKLNREIANRDQLNGELREVIARFELQKEEWEQREITMRELERTTKEAVSRQEQSETERKRAVETLEEQCQQVVRLRTEVAQANARAAIEAERHEEEKQLVSGLVVGRFLSLLFDIKLRFPL